MKRVLCEDRNGNQSKSLDAANDGIPGRTHAACEDPAPDKSHPEDAHPADDKIELLYPSTWTMAERADGLPPGIIAGTGRTLNQIDDRKQHSTSNPVGKPQQEPLRDRGRSKGICFDVHG